MDCPNKIPASGTSAQQHKMHKNCHPGQALDTTEKIETGETGPDHSLGIADIAAPAIVTCAEPAPNHNNGMGTAAIESPEGNPVQHTKAAAAEPIGTHHTDHITDHPLTATHQVTALRTTVDHIHTHHTDHQNIMHTSENHASTRGSKDHIPIGRGRAIYKNVHQISTVQKIIPSTQEKNQSLD